MADRGRGPSLTLPRVQRSQHEGMIAPGIRIPWERAPELFDPQELAWVVHLAAQMDNTVHLKQTSRGYCRIERIPGAIKARTHHHRRLRPPVDRAVRRATRPRVAD